MSSRPMNPRQDRRRQAVRASLGLLLMLQLGGCMPDFRSEHLPARIYWLESVAVQDPPAVDVTVTLVPGLDSDRIWVLEPDQRLNYYAGAFWPERLQLVLQSLLERSLAASDQGEDVRVLVEKFFAVGDPAAGPPDVVLEAEIETPALRCPFRSHRAADSDRLRDIVAAHQAMVDALVTAVAGTVRGGVCP